MLHPDRAMLVLDLPECPDLADSGESAADRSWTERSGLLDNVLVNSEVILRLRPKLL